MKRSASRKEPLEFDRLTAVRVKELYEKHGDALAAYACCCGLDFAAAEDTVQKVFLKLLRGETSVPRTPVAYLYRAIRFSVTITGFRDATLERGIHRFCAEWFLHSQC